MNKIGTTVTAYESDDKVYLRCGDMKLEVEIDDYDPQPGEPGQGGHANCTIGGIHVGGGYIAGTHERVSGQLVEPGYFMVYGSADDQISMGSDCYGEIDALAERLGVPMEEGLLGAVQMASALAWDAYRKEHRNEPTVIRLKRSDISGLDTTNSYTDEHADEIVDAYMDDLVDMVRREYPTAKVSVSDESDDSHDQVELDPALEGDENEVTQRLLELRDAICEPDDTDGSLREWVRLCREYAEEEDPKFCYQVITNRSIWMPWGDLAPHDMGSRTCGHTDASKEQLEAFEAFARETKPDDWEDGEELLEIDLLPDGCNPDDPGTQWIIVYKR